jgi:starch phosphorylase
MPGSIFPLEVQPRIPPQLERLPELADDLMYSWDRPIRSLFHRLDRELWEACGHSPKAFLRRVSQQSLDEAAQTRSYMEDYRRVTAAYDAYMEHGRREELDECLDSEHDLVAYFCLEFGFHESFPIYSGGLGILAGDHCKAASDLGLPFVAVGLLYDMGFFTQTIDGFGRQQASYSVNHPHNLPVTPTLTPDGQHLTLALDFPGRELKVRVWTARAGHIKLYLLDTNLPENSDADRAITHQLYGGDRELRLQQELLLGVGGVRALRSLGLRPTVWHINEGHAAFQLLERCRFRMEEGMHFDCALELVAAGTVFTTHTPVPAGHDVFDKHLIEKYLGPVAASLGQDLEAIYAIGANHGPGFNMTSLALRGSRFHNGVSAIHGRVASEMEAGIWPQIPPEENPITHVTNGVHLETFLAREWASLFDLRFDDWRNELLNEEYWERLQEIPHYQYWSIHKALKQQMLHRVHTLVVQQQRRNGLSEALLARMVAHIEREDSDCLVMGFARRFATYKRAGLLFQDPGRLAAILNDAERPAIIIFAGKAHPHDEPGQHLIKEIHDYSLRPEFIGRILLLENYDMSLARHLVTGVDVWLNTPEYPLEASGTSGQKAGLNGAVNVSVLDGWWGEGYTGDNGWAIVPRGEQFEHSHRQHEEANDLLNIFEHEMLPMYYRRDGGGYSADWVELSIQSMQTTIPRFNAQRMLMDYVRNLYTPARKQRRRLEADQARDACRLAEWKARVRQAWPGVSLHLMLQPPAHLYHDEKILLRVRADLNGLAPQDVRLECLLGRQNAAGEFRVLQRAELPAVGEDGRFTEFSVELLPEIAGLQQYKLRLFPHNELMSHPFELGCMIWL